MGKVKNSLAVKSMVREVSGEGQMIWKCYKLTAYEEDGMRDGW